MSHAVATVLVQMYNEASIRRFLLINIFSKHKVTIMTAGWLNDSHVTQDTVKEFSLALCTVAILTNKGTRSSMALYTVEMFSNPDQ